MWKMFSISISKLIFLLCLSEAAHCRLVSPTFVFKDRIYGPWHFPYVIPSKFAPYHQIMSWMSAICYYYSEFASCITIGHSHEGRDITILKLTSGSDLPWQPDGTKQAIFIEGGIHAREWAGSLSVILSAKRLMRTLPGQELLSKFDWYLLPVMNPDGYDRTRRQTRAELTKYGCHPFMRHWRKNGRNMGFDVHMVQDNNEDGDEECYPGVDLDRNFPTKWQRQNDTCLEDYPGETALSEPESRAVFNFVTALKSNIVAYLSVHANGQLIQLPNGCNKTGKPSDYEDLLRVAIAGSLAIVASEGHRIYSVIRKSGLYPDCDNWAKSIGIKYTYTIKLYPGTEAKEKYLIEEEEDGVSKAGMDLWHFVQAVATEISKYEKI